MLLISRATLADARLRALAPPAASAVLLLVWVVLFAAQTVADPRAWYFGFDYGLYAAQSRALWTRGPAAIYSADLAAVAYPPIFAWLFTPFGALPPRLGFAVWTGVNLVGALHLAWRAANFFSATWRLRAALLAMVSFPIGFALFTGQVQIWLAVAIAECYLALREGREFRAGLFLGCLVLKPQYGAVLGLALLMKRRWTSLCGAVTSGLVIVAASLAVAGPAGLVGWIATVVRLTDAGVSPRMVGWTQLLVHAPHLPGASPATLAAALGLCTLAAALLALRGPWRPRDQRFPEQFCLLLLAGLLAIPHSYTYGAAVLVVPVAELLAGKVGGVVRWALLAGAVVPTIILADRDLDVDFRDIRIAATLFTLCLLAAYARLVMSALPDLTLARRPPRPVGD